MDFAEAVAVLVAGILASGVARLMAARRRFTMGGAQPRAASPDRNAATAPGSAGRGAKPHSWHQAVNRIQSASYARRAEAVRDASA